MNSFNHYSLGSCVEWMYEYCLGISVSEETAGFEKIRIKPYLDKSGKITSASGSYRTGKGGIEIAWKNRGGYYTYDIRLPDGADAEFDFNGLNIKEKKKEDGIIKFILE